MMAIFRKAERSQAYLKAGIMGFAGSGKTFTATTIAVGLIRLMRERGLREAERPVMFLDTETGADWVRPTLEDNGIELYVGTTRAFRDLIPAVQEAEQSGSVLIIDSITHFWREFMESYIARKNRKRGLEFQDWSWLKEQWGKFTDVYVNSQAHIIMCGRAGFEYDFFENEQTGKRELEKTGIKMKAENETGFEPSLLILMERHIDMPTKKAYREAHIIKDRSTLIDGMMFTNPSFEDFRPHIEFLNLGGVQSGVDTTRTSAGMIEPDQYSERARVKLQREVVIDEIKVLMSRHYGTGKDDTLAKLALMEKCFGTGSRVKIENTFTLDQLRAGYDALHAELVGTPAADTPPISDESLPGTGTDA